MLCHLSGLLDYRGFIGFCRMDEQEKRSSVIRGVFDFEQLGNFRELLIQASGRGGYNFFLPIFGISIRISAPCFISFSVQMRPP